MGNECLLLEPPSLWYFLTAAQAGEGSISGIRRSLDVHTLHVMYLCVTRFSQPNVGLCSIYFQNIHSAVVFIMCALYRVLIRSQQCPPCVAMCTGGKRREPQELLTQGHGGRQDCLPLYEETASAWLAWLSG